MQSRSATDKGKQIQKFGSILEKEQGMKKIMSQDNLNWKHKIRLYKQRCEKNKKCEEDLKILSKSKERFQNLNKEQNQKLKEWLQK